MQYWFIQLLYTAVAFVWVWSTPGHGYMLDGVYKLQSGIGMFGPISPLLGVMFGVSVSFVMMIWSK